MPAGLSTDVSLGTSSVVGRYFGLVSTVPSVLLAAWVYILLASGAWQGEPDLDTLRTHGPLDSPGSLIAAIAFALTIAFVAHPLQFALVQLLEGYWGQTAVGRQLQTWFILRHLKRIAYAERLSDQGEELEDALPPLRSKNLSEHLDAETLETNLALARNAVRSQVLRNAAGTIRERYPREPIHTMPTALGNVLRRHELLAGAAIKLPVLRWATHIGMVADPKHTAYVNDQRTQLDLAVRTAASAALASAFTFALLWNEASWATLTLIPYTVAVGAYRGAVSSAGSYGQALRAWTDLNRFRVYQALNLKSVDSTNAERTQNAALIDLAKGFPTLDIQLDQHGTAGIPAPDAT